MAELQHLSADAAAEDIVTVLQQDGAAIIDELISPAFIAELRAETDPFMEATDNGFDDFTGFQTTRTGGLLGRSAKCRELIAHGSILAPCEQFLAPYCERVQLHLSQIIRIRPGETAQMIHRDRWAWGKHLAHIEPQFNTIWALTDFTRDNGATQVVPGSSQWPDNAEIGEEQVVQAEMAAGSVLVYSGCVFHGGGANRSTRDRIGLNITYTLGWLRQEENQYLSCPPEIAKEFDRSLQELAGYAMGQYALGYYSPPGAPGEQPEIAPPQYALGHPIEVSMMGLPVGPDSN